MIPEKFDPIWREIVLNCDQYRFKSLATKLMMMRVKMIVDNEQEDFEKRISLATDVAFDFFDKNQTIVQADLNYIFKKEVI